MPLPNSPQSFTDNVDTVSASTTNANNQIWYNALTNYVVFKDVAATISVSHTFTAAQKFADGAVGTPGITFTNDLDCGLYRIGTNNIGVAVNGAKVLDVATTGLGVTGTLSATAGLTIGGALTGATTGAFSSNVTIGGTLGAGVTTLSGSATTMLTLTSSAVSTGVVLDNTNGLSRGGFVQFKQNGTVAGLISTSGAVQGTTASNIALFAETGNQIELYTNGSATLKASLNTSGVWAVVGNSTVGGTFGVTGVSSFGSDILLTGGAQSSYIANSASAAFYYSAQGGSAPFDVNGNLIIQPRTSLARDIILATGTTTPTARLTISGSTGAAAFSGGMSATTGTFTSTLVTGTAAAIGWSGQSLLKNNADGVIQLSNNAATDFGRLQFGGTTSSFPSLKRSGVTIQARLADDSDFADLRASTVTAVGFSGPLTGNVTGNVSGSAATVTSASQTAITTLSNLVTVGALNSGSITSGFGSIDVGTDAISGGLVTGAKFKGGSSAPTITPGISAVIGTSPTVTTVTGSNDAAGAVNLTVGTSPGSAGVLFSVTYASAYTTTAPFPNLSRLSLAANISGVYVSSYSTTGFDVSGSITGVSLGAGSQINVGWHVIQ